MDFNEFIKSVKRLAHLPAMIIFILQFTLQPSIEAQQKPTRQSSLEAFSKGDYELAYSEFSELLITYPKDPLYKYYSGVCLVKMTRDPEKALLLLSEAQQGSAMVRAIPSDALFWLGRAQQMSGMFNEAISSYNEFTEQYGKKASRDLDVPSFIQECNDRKGKVDEPSGRQAIAEKIKIKPEEPVKERAEPPDEVKQIADKLPDRVPGNFDLILSEALDYQFKADSLYGIAGEWKKSLENLAYKEKTDLRTRITETETLAASYQKRADQKYTEAQAAMNSTSFAQVNVPGNEILPPADSIADKLKNDDKSTRQNIVSAKGDISVTPEDTMPAGKIIRIPDGIEKKDTSAIKSVKKESLQPAVKPAELFFLFEVRPVKDNSTEKIPVNAAIPQGLIYRIQIAVFRNPVAPSYFKGISPVYGFRVAGTDNTAYFAGMFRKLADAKKALATVKQKGFRDAFIVPLSGGKAVSSERAVILEKEWGKKPFLVPQQIRQIPADTIPPELCFRIEVIRSVKPVKEDVLEKMKKMAGTRGLDIESLDNDASVYLIGKFITYESAESYADLLRRNGYRDAKVVARLGRKELPVETARDLFEKLE